MSLTAVPIWQWIHVKRNGGTSIMNNIRRVCKHVVHLLNNLLDVYRLNEAKEIRNDVPFDLHELLERTAAGFSHIINNKGILFNCDFKDTEVKLYGDVRPHRTDYRQSAYQCS